MVKLKNIFLPTVENNYFPIFLKRKFLGYYILILVFLKILTLPLLFFATKSPFFAQISKYLLLDFINSERKKAGLSPLVFNPFLEKSAFLKAKDMIEKDYFSHYSPTGLSPWYWFKLAGYEYKIAGENLAIGFLETKEVHEALMNSPSHRQNILNPAFKEIGISVLEGEFNGENVYLVVQHFGTPPRKLKVQKSTFPEISTSTPETSTLSLVQTTTQPTKNQKPKIYQTLSSNFSFKATKFALVGYNSLLNKIVYFTILFLIFSITLTIFYDIFIYRRFILDYKQLIPAWFLFFIILLIFLYFDQSKIILFIPHRLQIYGI